VSPALARRLNAVFVLAMCAMLLGAYGVQFILRELPCPLCLLQRAGMLGVACGLARAAFALALTLAVANALTVLLMCGLSECPENPTRYRWLL